MLLANEPTNCSLAQQPWGQVNVEGIVRAAMTESTSLTFDFSIDQSYLLPIIALLEAADPA
jgi:hypothetical protein